MAQLEKCKMSLLFLTHKFVTTLLGLVAGRNVSHITGSSSSSDWVYVLSSIDEFNRILSDFQVSIDPECELKTLLHGIRNRGAHLHENFGPSHYSYMKQITSSRILQVGKIFFIDFPNNKKTFFFNFKSEISEF